jgi:hypothetical protein
MTSFVKGLIDEETAEDSEVNQNNNTEKMIDLNCLDI